MAFSRCAALSCVLRVGRVPLLAVDAEKAPERATPPDLGGIADVGPGGRLANKARIEAVALLARPGEKLLGPVHRWAFLVGGEEKGTSVRGDEGSPPGSGRRRQ